MLSDYEQYPDWVPGMLRSEVISREGSLTVCAFSVSGLKRLNYTLELEHQGYETIRFRQVAGDLRHYQGMWSLEDSPGGEETLVVCRMEMEAGLPLPGWIVRRAMDKQLSDNLQALKKRAERGGAALVSEEVEPTSLDEGEACKGEKERILEVVRRGKVLDVWFMGDHYRSRLRGSIHG